MTPKNQINTLYFIDKGLYPKNNESPPKSIHTGHKTTN